MSTSNKIVLISSDGESFEIEEAVGHTLKTISHMIEDKCADQPIPIQNVTGEILSKVLEYCKAHVNDGSTDEAAAADWDANFIKGLDLNDTIFKVILAANYLNVEGLLGLACQTVADHIKDKTVEEIREIFNVENDFTEEEEAEIRKENAWSFE